MKTKAAHSHGWLVGILGLAVGITLMVGFPKLHAVAGVILLVALFHLVGIAVVLGSVYALAPARFGRVMERFRRKAADDKGVDFGWSWGAMNGPWIAAAAFVTRPTNRGGPPGPNGGCRRGCPGGGASKIARSGPTGAIGGSTVVPSSAPDAS